MQAFKVDGMTCGHCVHAVTEAVQGIDPGAKVEVDLATGTVKTDSRVRLDQLEEAIRAEGYQVHPLATHG